MTIRGVLGWIAALILALFAAMVIASMFATTAHAQTPRWPDYGTLQGLGVDQRAALAIAWEESTDNIDPKLRGHHCWYTISARADTIWTRTWPHILEPSRQVIDTIIVIPKRVHHEPDCEVGRFQIKPSTARQRCPSFDVFTYGGNLACFAKMFAEDAEIGGTLSAIRHHNGSGPLADQYVQRVLRTIGWLTVTEGT